LQWRKAIEKLVVTIYNRHLQVFVFSEQLEDTKDPWVKQAINVVIMTLE
jgi:hypothetical protein